MRFNLHDIEFCCYIDCLVISSKHAARKYLQQLFTSIVNELGSERVEIMNRGKFRSVIHLKMSINMSLQQGKQYLELFQVLNVAA